MTETSRHEMANGPDQTMPLGDAANAPLDWPYCCDGAHLKAVLVTDPDEWVPGHNEGYTQVVPVEDAAYAPLDCPACGQAGWFRVETYVHIEPSGEPFRVGAYTNMGLPNVVCEECHYDGPIDEFRKWPS